MGSISERNVTVVINPHLYQEAELNGSHATLTAEFCLFHCRVTFLELMIAPASRWGCCKRVLPKPWSELAFLLPCASTRDREPCSPFRLLCVRAADPLHSNVAVRPLRDGCLG